MNDSWAVIWHDANTADVALQLGCNGSTGLGWEDWASCSSDHGNWRGWRSCGDEPAAEGFKVPRTHAKSRVKLGKCNRPSICAMVYESLSFGVLDLSKY